MKNRKITMLSVAAFALFILADAASAYYNPRLGRFLNRDPINEPGAVLVRQTARPATTFMPRDPVSTRPPLGQGGLNRQYADGMNLYEYVRNQPTELIDPLGLQTSQPDTQPNGVPIGTDCGIRIKQTPYCLFGSKGHTWIEWDNAGPGSTSDFPRGWIQGSHKCEKGYVNNEWKTKTTTDEKSCSEIKQCLLDAMKEWDDEGYNYPDHTCRSFADYAISKCGLTKSLYKTDLFMPFKYCCSKCAKIPDSLP